MRDELYGDWNLLKDISLTEAESNRFKDAANTAALSGERTITFKGVKYSTPIACRFADTLVRIER